MISKKNIIIPALTIATVVGIGVYGIGKVSADEDKQISIAEKIAEKFNLNKDYVQEVIDNDREEMRERQHLKLEERLSELVSKGELTQDQKETYLEKLSTMRSERDNGKDLSREERQAERENHRAEMEKWAEENGLNLENLNIGAGFGKGGRMK